MGFVLFGLFVVLPILEIAVFIQVGGLIGLWPTLACIFATAIIGVAILRHQGLGVLRRAYHTANAGQMPVAEVFDGFCLVIAGAFLLTPGFVTDTFGFLLLVPAVRTWLRTAFADKLVRDGAVNVTIDGQTVGPRPRGPGGRRPGGRGGMVIDAEYETVSPDQDVPQPPEPARREPEADNGKPPATRLPPTGKDSPWSP